MSRLKLFTLLELLVVVAILGILITILIPSMLKTKLKSQTTVCMSNLQQNGLGFTRYGKDNNLILPKRQYENQAPLGHHSYKRLDVYMGLGVLARDEYVDGRIFYCPAREDEVTTNPNWPDTIPRYQKLRNRKNPQCGGWDTPGVDRWRGDYDYRNSYERRRLRLTDEGDLMLSSDHWNHGYAKFYHKNQNISVLYLGGHVSLVRNIPEISIPNGNLPDMDLKITALFED
ncbi:MAG: prepilin-type N-terminal cleavage/methylation domain-containing protein [Lentisphaerales bacterium]|nr:prepilin-type N-terminal cleavage/methylation domain-containing protein [Lentisphaerales bacterium]